MEGQQPSNREQQIQESTKLAREDQQLNTFPGEIEAFHPFTTGYYQHAFIWERQNQPEIVSFPEAINKYVEELLAQGEPAVNIVDFGAGAAGTLCETASILEDKIKAGKVKLVATNIASIPNLEDLPKLKDYLTAHQISLLEKVLKEGLVEFVKADILELSQLFSVQKAHILMSINVLASTGDYNDVVLKKIGELLHPRLGTAIIRFPRRLTSRHDLNRRQLWQLLQQGVNYLVNAGFSNIHTQRRPNVNQVDVRNDKETIFQAPDAPKLFLQPQDSFL